ncbi:MAG: outer membrane beta-barrel protein [Pseudomonadota bacterium]
MNKQILLAALLILAPLSAAQAAVYAGADLLLDSVDMKNTASENYSESTIGPGIHLGDHFAFGAVELGYSTTRKTFQDTDLRFNRLTGDGISYVPLGGMLNLLVTAGLSETNFGASSFTHKGYTQDNVAKTTRVATTLLHGNEFDWRAGTGFSFAFGNGYEFHVIGRYEPLVMRGLSNYALSMDTGFNIDLN